MLMMTSTRRSSLLRAAAVLVGFTLATPAVHAAPDAPRKASASKKKLGKRAEADMLAARAQELQDALEKAQGERDRELALVQPLLAGGHDEKAAQHLFASALNLKDPVLYLEAAERFLAAAARHRPDAIIKGRESAEAARDLLARTDDPASGESTDLRTVRIPHASVEELLDRCATVQRRLTARAAELRVQQKGRQELAAGASLLFVGLTGAGVLAGGMVYRAARKRELAGIAGHESEYNLSALDAQGQRADAMIGVGAAVTVIGVVLGASLLAIGARDLRGRKASQQAGLHVAPTLGGLVLSGQF